MKPHLQKRRNDGGAITQDDDTSTAPCPVQLEQRRQSMLVDPLSQLAQIGDGVCSGNVNFG